MDLKAIIEKYDGEYAFVAMPFNPRFNHIYNAIKNGCNACKIVAFRIDDLIGSHNITFEIMEGIQHAKYVIADITPDLSESDVKILTPDYARLCRRSNPNVMYEIGYAEGLNKEIILLANEDGRDYLPFDLKSRRYISYSEKQLDKLTEKLRVWFGGIVENTIPPIIVGNAAPKEELCIPLKPDCRREQIVNAIISWENSHNEVKAGSPRLKLDLEKNSYKNIGLESYLWLIGWCYVTGGRKNASLLAREVATEMFGFVPQRYLEKNGDDLKKYRYGSHRSSQTDIVLQHKKQLAENPSLLLTPETLLKNAHFYNPLKKKNHG
ncbi:MAG: hypothetical protein HUU50_07890 [Candidatus Brocadiae bacterium]|nr:hypothetical protein [Candidatus Brocadiia bacterium]